MVAADRVDRRNTLGLYVVGRQDGKLKQLEAQVVHDHVSDKLRIASVESILAIAELVQDGQINKEEAISLLLPPPPTVDGFIGLLKRVAAEAPAGVPAPASAASLAAAAAAAPAGAASPQRLNLLTPVADVDGVTASETIHKLLDAGLYVFGDRTPRRQEVKPGDRIAFYEARNGVVAEAEVATAPERKTTKLVHDPEKFPWSFKLTNMRYLKEPVVIDADMRSALDAFKGKDTTKPWGWFVVATRAVTERDFDLLVGQS